MPKNIREFTPEEKIQRAYDMIQIKNVMARHAFYHAASRHDIEMETLWAHNAPNVSWGNMGGFQIGRDVVWSFYVKPHIGKVCKPGEAFMHTLTTPLVEIAGDGKTAQAMWYTPGYGTGRGGPDAPADAPLKGEWMYERYAIDFIKEDGEWKIWHFFVGTDFSFEAGTEYASGICRPWASGSPSGASCAFRISIRPSMAGVPIRTSRSPMRPGRPEISYGPEPFMKEGK